MKDIFVSKIGGCVKLAPYIFNVFLRLYMAKTIF